MSRRSDALAAKDAATDAVAKLAWLVIEADEPATSPTLPPGTSVPAWIPAGTDGWWIAQNGDGEPCVWRPMPARPRLVVSQALAGADLWPVLAAALPDRGACEHCTALPCPEHGGPE